MEAIVSSRGRPVWYRIKDFFTARTLSITGSIIFLLLVLFLLWPIIILLARSIYGPEGFTLQYYKAFLTKSYYYSSFFNTLLLGILTTSVCLSVGFCIAYMTTRGPVYLRLPLKVIAFLPLIAPPYIFALSLIILLGRNGIITNLLNLGWSIYGFGGCVLAQTLAFLPLAYMMIENTLCSLNPNLEDSAANLGASEGKILRSITIPLLTSGFLKAGLIVFVLAVAEFGNVALLAGRTPFLAPDTYTMITGAEADFNMGSVLSTFLILPCAVIFAAQTYLIKGKDYTTIVGKPVAAEPRRINPIILTAFLTVSFIACAFVLVTFGVVGVGAFTKIIGVDNTFVLKHILNMRSYAALVSSVKLSFFVGLLGSILGVVLAYVIMRGKFRGRTTLEGIALAGFAFPGTAMGLGYLMAFNKAPLLLTGTVTILVLCCVFREFAVGMEAGITKLQQLSIEVEEASLNLGASTAKTFKKIVLPIIFPAFMYGFLYLFMRTMITLSSVIFLAATGTYLVSIFIFDAAAHGEVGLACATSLKLIVIVAVCLAALQVLSRWTGLSVTKKGG